MKVHQQGNTDCKSIIQVVASTSHEHDATHPHHHSNIVFSYIGHIVDVEHREDAFYICNVSDIVQKHDTWMKKMPRIHPHYAVKCNPTSVICEVLSVLGTGFDCASKQEIADVLALGVHPSRIIFANPAKLASHITFAYESGVTKMTFDSEAELYKVKHLHPNAEMILRIKYDDPLATYVLGAKFGCDPESEDVPRLLHVALHLGINVIGVSFHIGSSSRNPHVFRGAIKAAHHVFDVAARMGFHFDLLDIGGGFAGEHGTDILETSSIINKALDDFFPVSTYPYVAIVSEPGRYYVSSAFTLATNIHSMKIKHTDASTEKSFMYYVDAGVYSGFIDKFSNVEYQPIPLFKDHHHPIVDETCMYQSTIFGPTCDAIDTIRDNVLLPQLDIGDWLIFENLGAYSLSISTRFNGFQIPSVYVIADENTYWHLLDKSELFTSDRFGLDKLSNVKISELEDI